MPDLNEDMKNSADYAIRSAKERFGLLLDFSEPSITALETILEKIYWGLSGTHDEGGVNGLIYNTAIIWGSYLGEFMRHKWGGNWEYDGSDHIYIINNLRFSPVSYIYKKIIDHRNPGVKDYLLEANWKISASISKISQEVSTVSQVDKSKKPIDNKPTKKAFTINKDVFAVIIIFGTIFILILVFIILLFNIIKGRILASSPITSPISTITNLTEEIAILPLASRVTNSPSPTITILPTYTPKPTMTTRPSQTPSPTYTQISTLTPTNTAIPIVPSITPTRYIPSRTPTSVPVVPTDTQIPPTIQPTPTVYIPPPVVLESCGIDPSSIEPGFAVTLVFSADFSSPGYGFDTELAPDFPGQNGCSGIDDNGDGTASCNGSSGLLPQSTTVTVTFKSSVGDCVASYGTP